MSNIKNLNSEIQKYIWKDFSTHKVITLPLVLLAMTFSIGALLDEGSFLFIEKMSKFLFFLSVTWGSYQAMNSITEELNDGTWDYQRLSATSPFQMTLGKLIGSTLYSWYIGFFIIAIYVFAKLSTSTDLIFELKSIALLILSAALCNAMSMFVTTLLLQKKNYQKKSPPLLAFVLIILFTCSFSQFVDKNSVISWFGWDFNRLNFSLSCALIFLGWSVLGCYRILKQDLMYRVTPIIWAFFMLFIILYFKGFADFGAFSALIIATISVYVMLCVDKINVTNIKIFIREIKAKNFLKAAESMPKWLVSFLITLEILLIMLFTTKSHHIIFTLSVLAFMIRDVAIVHFFKLSKNNDRAGLNALLYITIFYTAVPMLLYAISLPNLATAFIPQMTKDISTTNIFLIITQAAITTFVAVKRWKNWEV